MASIFVRTIIIYLFLSISLKIMGKRQLGELEIGELVSTLVISEVAALPVADPDIPLMNAIIPVLVIVCLEIIISSVKNKYEKFKKYVEGEPIFLIYKGALEQDALSNNRISINELLSEIRTQGIGGISEAHYAILEPNGKISVFKKDDNFAHTLIIDGIEHKSAMQRLGYDGAKITERLKELKVKKSEVFLMSADDQGNIYIVRKEKES